MNKDPTNKRLAQLTGAPGNPIQRQALGGGAPALKAEEKPAEVAGTSTAVTPPGQAGKGTAARK